MDSGVVAGDEGGLQQIEGMKRKAEEPLEDDIVDTTLSDDDMDDGEDDGAEGGEPPARKKKTKGRVKIKMEFITNKLRRYTTFSKRKTGIMKKVSVGTGAKHAIMENFHFGRESFRCVQDCVSDDLTQKRVLCFWSLPDGSRAITFNALLDPRFLALWSRDVTRPCDFHFIFCADARSWLLVLASCESCRCSPLRSSAC